MRVLASNEQTVDTKITGESTVVQDPRVPTFGTRIVTKQGMFNSMVTETKFIYFFFRHKAFLYKVDYFFLFCPES